MSTARIVVPVIALGARGVAARLASGSDTNKPPAAPVVTQLPTVEVLLARSQIGLGQLARSEDQALRSLADTSAADSAPKDQPIGRGGSDNVVRYGAASQIASQK